MSTIVIKCIDQVLIPANTPVIASGGVQEDIVEFEFDDTWSGYSKMAVFYQQKGSIYYSLVDANNDAVIPREVIACKGTMFLGVMGVNGSTTRTSKILRYRIDGGALDGFTVVDPSDDIYQQLLATWNDIKTECQDTKDAQAAFIEQMTTDVSEAIEGVNSATNIAVTNAETATDACYGAINALQLQWFDFDGHDPSAEVSEDDKDLNGGYPAESEG